MRKYDLPDRLTVCVSCASGVEKVTKSELNRLNIDNVPIVNGIATFEGDKQLVADCNVNLRTADRVYLKIGEFRAEDFDSLFDGVKSLDFENYIPYGSTIIVNGKCVKSKLFAISACQSVIKKAIITRLCQKYAVNAFDEGDSVYEIVFSIFKDNVDIMLNTSGQGLHKRGYRDLVGIAPIKETLASSLLLLSDTYYKNPFCDPFCGSGTLAIEGARIALNIASGRDRKFAFDEWKNFDKTYHRLSLERARDNEKLDRKLEFFASDIDPKAIKLSRRHAEKAGVDKYIKFKVADVKDFKSGFSFGTIVTNPPYGERVFDKMQAEECYKLLGKVYRELDRWSLFVITSYNVFERKFGKKADRTRKLFNSNRECQFYYYYSDKVKSPTVDIPTISIKDDKEK